MIMAHISVSNHFKRQENALSDRDSGPQGLRMCLPAMSLRKDTKENERM